MTQICKSLTQRNSPEDMLNLLYNTGFRLTGSHNETSELVTRAYHALVEDKKVNLSTALKSLCHVYINTTAKQGKNILTINSSTEKIQKALLSLPPHERLIVILRDIVGLDYAEMANVTNLDKKDIPRILTSGRRCLAKHKDF